MTKRSDQSSKPDRKTIERNRRNHMKSLCFKLASIIPSQYFKTPKNMISQRDQLDLAARYIKQLRKRIDKLKGMKEQAMKSVKPNGMSAKSEMNLGSVLPVVELRELGSGIEVVLITGLQRNFMLYEIISVLEEEGAEVVSSSFSTVGYKIFHTVHAQVKILRVGVEPSRICQRLYDLVY